MTIYAGRCDRPQRHPPKFGGVAFTLGLGAITALGGCASYREQPVDPVAVEQAWQALNPSAASKSIASAMAEGRVTAKQFDLTDGISLEEAEITALFFNPAIRATRMQVGVPQAEAAHVRLWEDPELDVNGEYILADVDDPLIFGTGLAITIPLSGRPAVAERLAQARIDEREAAVVGAEWALLVALRNDWLQLAAIEARIAVLQESESTLHKLITLVPKFRAARAVSIVDERWLIIQHKTIIDALHQAESDRQERQLAIVALLGLHPARLWRIKPRMDDTNQHSRAADLQMLLSHPSMRQVLASYQVAERQLQLEVRKQYPDLSIGFGGGNEEGDPRIALGLSLLPISVWNRNKQGIAMASAERDVIAETIRSALQALVHENKKTSLREETSRKRLDFLRNDLAPLADQQVADARRLTQLGELDLFLLADAIELARTTRLDLLEAELAHRMSLLERDALAGPDLETSGNAEKEEALPRPAGKHETSSEDQGINQ